MANQPYDEFHHLDSPLLYGGSNPHISETSSVYGGPEYTPSTVGAGPSVMGMGSQGNPYKGDEVTVTGQQMGVNGATDRLSGVTHDAMPAYNGSYGYGNAKIGYRSASQAHDMTSHPQYDRSLNTHEGVEIPFGHTGQTLSERAATPGAAQGIAAHGSIDDINDYEGITGHSLTGLTPAVRDAVDQKHNYTPISNRP